MAPVIFVIGESDFFQAFICAFGALLGVAESVGPCIETQKFTAFQIARDGARSGM